ncbi:MAG TPA: hypothetical protein VJ694_02615 [Patescibacteria group bacterium]|nr:hypothetical protein [Patescibacteria group bacterium]
MQPLRFGIDFDGVIVDHRAHKLRLAGELGVALEPWQTNTNLLRAHMPDEESYRRLQEPLYGAMTVQAPAVAGALEGLARLPGEVYVISARRPGNEASALEWMAKNGLHDVVPRERVIFCESGRDKRAHCERLAISMFLDDKLSYLGHLPETLTRVLFDDDGIAHRLTLPADVRVARDWPEFLALAAERAAQPA